MPNESKEYVDKDGVKVRVYDNELSPDVLKSSNPDRVKEIASLLEDKELCLNCRFWNPTENRKDKSGEDFPINGQCRVNAPQIVVISRSDGDGDFFNAFPLIGPFQWCGKYEVIQ